MPVRLETQSGSSAAPTVTFTTAAAPGDLIVIAVHGRSATSVAFSATSTMGGTWTRETPTTTVNASAAVIVGRGASGAGTVTVSGTGIWDYEAHLLRGVADVVTTAFDSRASGAVDDNAVEVGPVTAGPGQFVVAAAGAEGLSTRAYAVDPTPDDWVASGTLGFSNDGGRTLYREPTSSSDPHSVLFTVNAASGHLALAMAVIGTAAKSYESEVLADAPTAYFRLGEGVGATTMLDSSGNGFHGAYTNPYPETSPILGHPSLVDDNDTSYRTTITGQYGSAAVVAGAGPFAVEAVIMTPDVVDDESSRIARRTNLWTLTARWYSTQGNPRVLEIGFTYYRNAGTTPTTLYFLPTRAAGSAQHVAVVHDPGGANATTSLYVDGDLVDTVITEAASNGGITADASIFIGEKQSSGFSHFFIDEVAFYEGGISAARIAAHAAQIPIPASLTGSGAFTATSSLVQLRTAALAGSGTFTATATQDVPATITSPRDIPGLVAWYSAEALNLNNFDSVTTWPDLSGNGHHAVASGGVGLPIYLATGGPTGGPAIAFDRNVPTTVNNPAGLRMPAGALAGAAGEVLTSAMTGVSLTGMWAFGADGASQSHYTYGGTLYDSFGTTDRASLGTLSTSTWFRYGARSKSGQWTAWVNGVEKFNRTTNVVAWHTQPIIGRSEQNTTSSSFSGRFAAVILYDRELTTSERASLDSWLTANPSGGSDPSVPIVAADVAGSGTFAATVIPQGVAVVALAGAGDFAAQATAVEAGGDYSTEVLADAPLLYWKFDETSGGVANDSSGNGRVGVHVGGVAVDQPPLLPDGGRAVLYSGTNTYTVIDYASWMGVANYTVEAFIVAPPSSGSFYISSRWADFADSTMLFHVTNGKLSGRVSAGSNWTNWVEAVGATTLTPGETYHVAYRFTSASEVRVFVNGVSDGSAATSIVLDGSDWGALRLASAAQSVYSAIKIDSFAWYGTAIPDARLAAHYAASTAEPASPSVTATLVGSGDFAADVAVTTTAVAALAGAGDFIANASAVVTTAANLTGTGTFAATATIPGAAPANDLFADAAIVTISTAGGTYTSAPVSTEFATMEAGEPNPTQYDIGGKTLWWAYTPIVSGTATIDTGLSTSAGSGNDTEIAVWTGTSVSTLTQVAFNSDSGPGATSQITNLPVTAGTTYYIQAGGFSGATMNVVMRVVGVQTTGTPVIVRTATINDLAGNFTASIVAFVPAPAYLLVLTPQVDQPPATLTVAVANFDPAVEVTFAIDGTTVATDTTDLNGEIAETTLPVAREFLAGAHAVTATTTTQLATGSFDILRNANALPVTSVDDVEPPFVPEAVGRWVLQDLMPGGIGTWVMPINPTSMGAPHVRKTVAASATTAVRGPAHVSVGATPVDWQFAGFCPDQEFYNRLVAFSELPYRFYLTDHRSRVWTVAFTRLEITPRRRTLDDQGNPQDWMADYTVSVALFSQTPTVVPVVP